MNVLVLILLVLLWEESAQTQREVTFVLVKMAMLEMGNHALVSLNS